MNRIGVRENRHVERGNKYAEGIKNLNGKCIEKRVQKDDI